MTNMVIMTPGEPLMSQNDVQKFSAKQQKALTALLAGASQAEAAEAANVNIRTVQRWLTDDHFSQAVGDAVGPAVSLAVARLASLADLAINVMAETMAKETATTSQRLRASNFALSHLLKLGEYSDVIARIDALESRLNSLQSPQQGDNGDRIT